MFQAKYVDPQTKLYYSMAEEFSTVRNVPSDIITGYLTLRGEHNPIGWIKMNSLGYDIVHCFRRTD